MAALNHYQDVFGLNETFMSGANARAEKCGYSKFLSEALTYPPPKKFPTAPEYDQPDCNIWGDILRAAFEVNSCFDVYHLTSSCPSPWDAVQDGPDNYFNRLDVQKVLNVPPTKYKAHGGFSWQGNPGQNALGPLPSALGPLPSVIERTNNTIIAHGWLDYLLLVNGTLATIQNMTWNGVQGFQERPIEPLFVPYEYRQSNPVSQEASALYTVDTGVGVQGTAHTERGLTFTSVYSAGHGKIPRRWDAIRYKMRFSTG